MLLAIDVGNTNVCFAVFDETHVCGQWRANTTVKRTSDQWAAWLFTLMEIAGIDPKKITSSIISCVVPEVGDDMRELCEVYFGGNPLIVGDPNVHLDLDIVTVDSSEVGADLLVDAVAVKAFYKTPCLVLNMGTATTLSYINADGAFAGVSIAPGWNLMLDSLYRAAAKLPQVSLQKPTRVIAQSTVPAMQSGVFWGYIGLVEGLIQRAQKEHLSDHPGHELPVIASGGLVGLIKGETPLVTHYDPDLTLRGLKVVYDMNKSVFEAPVLKQVVAHG